ncbi:MAG TPA: ABC transporter substrate-binding protein [Thermoanaerobaculia bacterium]|jgi:iron complex transport system substrate-binding protein|nr:ABC transporter substrate-binding protein [Thermoanaerobaculia bacterium]
MMRCGILLRFGLAIVCSIVLGNAFPARAAARPVRLATLLPYVAEAFAQLPGRVLVVGSVRRSPGASLPAGATDLGSAHTPSFETLASLRPEITVIDRRLHAALVPRLQEIGGEVMSIDGGSVDSTFAGLLRVAQKIGGAAAEKAIAARIAQARREIAAARLARPVETLPLFGAPGSFLFITERTWLGDLLRQLGFKSSIPSWPAGGEAIPGYVEVSPELLTSFHPRIALLLAHGDAAALEKAFRERFARLIGTEKDTGPVTIRTLDPALFAGNPGLDMGRAAHALQEIAAEAPARSVKAGAAGGR